MRAALFARPGPGSAGCSVMFVAGAIMAASSQTALVLAAESSPAVLTNLLQLQHLHLDSQKPVSSYIIRLQGNVLWANPAQGRVVL